MPAKTQTGYTLIELLFTILLLGLLLTFANTGFQQLVDRHRQSSLANQLYSALNLGRSHAISVGQHTSLCAGMNSCENSNRWSNQLLIFHDTNQNGQLDAGERLLRQSELSNGDAWHWSSFRNRPHITFKPDGTTHGANGTFTLCRGEQAIRNIVISITGRVRMQAPSQGSRCS